MTSPDATSYGSGANGGLLDRELRAQHNPIWAVRVAAAHDSCDQRIVRVFACDEVQAGNYVRDVLGLIAVAVWLADD